MSYLTLYRKHKEDLFAQAENRSGSDTEILRKIREKLPNPLHHDAILTYIPPKLAQQIAHVQGRLEQEDPQKSTQKNSHLKRGF